MANESKKSSPIRWICTLLGALILCVGLIGLCLPTLFSTSIGKNLLIHFLQNRLHIALNIETLSLSWFGHQNIQGLSAIRTSDQLEINAQQIQTDASLWSLITQNDLGNMQIASPVIKISKPFPIGVARTPKNVLSASFSSAPISALAFSGKDLPLTGHVTVDEGKIALTPPGLDHILFDHLSLSLDLSSQDEMSLNLVAKTSEQNVQGEIALKASASQMRTSTPEVSMQATIAQLPVRGIDQIVSLFSRRSPGLLLGMLGPSLNIQSQLNLSKGNFDLNFNATADNLTAQMAAQSQNGTISLKSPASINYTLTPEAAKRLVALLPDSSALTVSKSTQFQCLLSQFTLPFPLQKNDIANATFDLTLTGPTQLPLVANNTAFSVNALNLRAISAGNGITLNARGNLQNQTSSSPFALDGKFNMQNPDGSTGSLAFNWLQMPTDFIAQLASTPHLTRWLGPQFDCTGDVAFIPNAPKFHLTLKSPTLTLSSMNFSLNDQLTLTSPCTFNYQVSKDALKNTDFQIGQDYTLQGTLNNLVVPVKQISLSRCDLSLSGDALSLTGTFPINLTKLQATVSLNTFDAIAVQVNGDPIQATFQGGYKSSTDELTIKQPLFLQFSVNDALLKKWAPAAPALAEPFILQCSLNPMTLGLSPFSPETLKAVGTLTIPKLSFSLAKQTVQILNAQLPFQWDPQAKSAAIEFSGSVPGTSPSAGNLQGQISLAGFTMKPEMQMKKALLNASLDFQNISSNLLEVLVNKSIGALIGDSFSGKLKLQSTPDKQNLSINWNSPYLNINSTFAMGAKAIDLQGTKNQLSWTLTPEGYKVLDSILTGPVNGIVPFDLQEKSTFAIQLDKLHLPISPNEKQESLADRIPRVTLDLNDLEAIATIRNQALSFFDRNSQETIQLSSVAFSINKSQKTEPMAFSLDTSVVSKGTQGGNKSGTLSAAGNILPSYDAQNQFDLGKLTSSGTLKLQQFPSRVLDIIARTRGRTDFPFSTLFGDVINADANLDLRQFSGPINVSVNSRNTRLSLAGTLAGGALTLRDHIYAQLKITPEISKLVLREFNPLSLSYLYSQDPVSIQILSDGFYMPLYPLQVQKTTIPEVSIELGKIVCRNEGNVNVALGLLKSKKYSKNSDLDLWFAPMDLHIKAGNVDMERTEVLIANNFDVALWGKVDLVKDYVDMVLGLTANTLNQAFGVKNLPENYVLTIPMRGKMDNVKIDTGKATSKVALLLAWQQAEAAGAMAGGPAGGLLGGLMNKMATLPDSDSKVPPAKHPFPWEVGGRKSKGKKATSHKTAEKKKHFKQNEKPLKQILKVIR